MLSWLRILWGDLLDLVLLEERRPARRWRRRITAAIMSGDEEAVQRLHQQIVVAEKQRSQPLLGE
jgi:hypothetical protein